MPGAEVAPEGCSGWIGANVMLPGNAKVGLSVFPGQLYAHENGASNASWLT